MFGRYVGKCGLKTSTPSPGLRNAWQNSVSKIFAPQPTTMLAAVTSRPYSALTNSAAAWRNSGRPRLAQ